MQKGDRFIERQTYKGTSQPEKDGYDHMNDAWATRSSIYSRLEKRTTRQRRKGGRNDLSGYRVQHPDYEQHITRWEFFVRSYLGGEDVAEGSYLTKDLNEDKDAYSRRKQLTPMDNHCRNVVHVYSSFLWRVPPTRNYQQMAESPDLLAFLKDANLDGQSFDSFMRVAQIWSSVYGHVWLMMDKPQQRRDACRGTKPRDGPYVTLFTPENVYDWKYERQLTDAMSQRTSGFASR